MTAAHRIHNPGDGWLLLFDEPFLTAERLPAGVDARSLSRFGDDCWNFGPLFADHQRGKSVIWDRFCAPLREGWRRAGWVMVNLPAPHELLDRVGTSRRAWPSPRSLCDLLGQCRDFDRWLADHGISSFTAIDQDVMADYARHIAALGLSQSRGNGALYAVSRLWGAAPHLPPGDRIAMPPWERAEIRDFLPTVRRGNENTTRPIHPAVISPLLIWALRFVEQFAPDIIAAWRERQRLLARIRQNANPQATAALTALFSDAATGGRPLPGTIERGIPQLARDYLCALHETSRDHIGWLLHGRGRLPLAMRTPMDTPIRGRVHGQPWTTHIDFAEAPALMRLLSAACLLVVVYLSGLRPAEVLELRVGCCPPPLDDGTGTLRYRLVGNVFKDARDRDGTPLREGAPRRVPWTTIAPVARAIEVLEQIATTPRLFPTVEPWNRPGGHSRDVRAPDRLITPETAKKRIEELAAWINRRVAEHGPAAEYVPDDPHGGLALSRFRRTVAWHIARLPTGRIALAVQYGHLRAAQSDAYGARSREGLRRVMDIESARSIAEYLQDLSDRLETGEAVSGPAATRLLASARARSARFEGMFLTDRDFTGLLTDPQFQVFDHPDAFLTCNKDPDKALCDPQRGKRPAARHTPPALDRCEPACANIARTDTHMNAAQAEIDQLQAEIADPLTPQPLAARQRQRLASLQAMIDRHHATRTVIDVKELRRPPDGQR